MMARGQVARLRDVDVTYPAEPADVVALDDVGLGIEAGTSIAMVGRSGSGKSTLVAVLALLRTPTRGNVLLDGRDTTAMTSRQRAQVRGTSVGIVFQSIHLEPTMSALDNVLLPWFLAGQGSRREAASRAMDVLDEMRIAELANRRPNQMSGGQRQRVAIARALFPRPLMLVADEPTGNLDEDTANVVAQALYSLTASGTAVVVVTHDEAVAAMADRTVRIERGRVVNEVTSR